VIIRLQFKRQDDYQWLLDTVLKYDSDQGYDSAAGSHDKYQAEWPVLGRHLNRIPSGRKREITVCLWPGRGQGKRITVYFLYCRDTCTEKVSKTTKNES